MPDDMTDVELEEARVALRDGLEKAKAMVHDYELLIRPHPGEPGEPESAEPAG
jgi:hypothetical protein